MRGKLALWICVMRERARKKMKAWVALAYFQQLDESFVKLLGDLTEEKMGSNGRTRLEIGGFQR
ncbi:flavonoid 3 5-methyltransferase-like [Prunus yedoensis var. nudiflora]|uniref:Flavonoid 3 5-methyltransferase-like n=1 Tax=Prunus yedoensis var. nudiflora TaxID=2094558 RepID=A0A314ZEF8_PRUYE|nr:flavonoid 3 5-methyltransferase-like [Prunus yedoensis var. nudiflora]